MAKEFSYLDTPVHSVQLFVRVSIEHLRVSFCTLCDGLSYRPAGTVIVAIRPKDFERCHKMNLPLLPIVQTPSTS